jgi:hypothetical protein
MRLLILSLILLVCSLPAELCCQVYHLESSDLFVSSVEVPSLYPKEKKDKECEPQDLGDLFPVFAIWVTQPEKIIYN